MSVVGTGRSCNSVRKRPFRSLLKEGLKVFRVSGKLSALSYRQERPFPAFTLLFQLPWQSADKSNKMTSPIEKHGWTAVSRSLEKLLAERHDKREPWPLKVEDISLPDGELVGKVMEYARSHLPAQTFNHSMRVFFYGMHIHPLPSSPS